MVNAIELSNVYKKYDGFSLNNINFKVPSGCIMGFVGENGAGKTTTIKAILDLIRLDEGNIQILGNNSTNLSRDIKSQVGVVFDGSNLYDTMRATDINHVMNNIYPNWDVKAFYNYIERFQLPKDKRLKDYSRGMKMKMSIAIALSHHSRLLILDEATSGLDPMVREEILDIFLDFIQEEDHTILLSTHIISDIDKIADYVTFIHKGDIIFSQNKDELIYQHGIIHCNKEDAGLIDPSYIVGVRENSFGVDVMLRDKDAFHRRYKQHSIDKASIEDIMLYTIRGNGTNSTLKERR